VDSADSDAAPSPFCKGGRDRHLFPRTAGYDHFRFSDYAKLTVIGVLIGAAGWPVITRISSAPIRL
jgi:hypothetical protein